MFQLLDPDHSEPPVTSLQHHHDEPDDCCFLVEWVGPTSQTSDFRASLLLDVPELVWG